MLRKNADKLARSVLMSTSRLLCREKIVAWGAPETLLPASSSDSGQQRHRIWDSRVVAVQQRRGLVEA